MPRHTILLDKEEIRIINVIKAIKDLKSIDRTLSFIVHEYAKSKSYEELLQKIKELKV